MATGRKAWTCWSNRHGWRASPPSGSRLKTPMAPAAHCRRRLRPVSPRAAISQAPWATPRTMSRQPSRRPTGCASAPGTARRTISIGGGECWSRLELHHLLLLLAEAGDAEAHHVAGLEELRRLHAE